MRAGSQRLNLQGIKDIHEVMSQRLNLQGIKDMTLSSSIGYQVLHAPKPLKFPTIYAHSQKHAILPDILGWRLK